MAQETAACPEEEVHAGSRPPVITVAISDRTMREDFFINDDLIIAGGCNFPGIPASEGGEKRFYKGIYRGLPANDSTLTWTQIGELPVEAAYGVTLSLPHKLIFVGGNHSAGGLSATYSLSLNTTGDAAILDTLPALPFA